MLETMVAEIKTIKQEEATEFNETIWNIMTD
jgi:hypothetical protein